MGLAKFRFFGFACASLHQTEARRAVACKEQRSKEIDLTFGWEVLGSASVQDQLGSVLQPFLQECEI